MGTFLLILAGISAIVATVIYAPDIKGWFHAQERQIGAKLKADIDKNVPKV